jgi:hypothetical protein
MNTRHLRMWWRVLQRAIRDGLNRRTCVGMMAV